jgi:hypothetical protein
VDSEALLQQFAPVVKFDSRELFFPCPVEPYVANSSLWLNRSELRGQGEITWGELDHRVERDSYLRFISDAERAAVLRAEASRLARKLLSPRLGRVGIFGRILDAIFLLSVFVRPTTPRLTTTAAALKSQRLGLDDAPTVYGRALRQGEWIVLHYSYFYAMNDWRSGYRGVNDHEADWEQAWIFIDPDDMTPQWIAASSHDHAGPDLRRHWSDLEVSKQDGRAVLFAGGGSHALYFRPGDYVTRIDVPGTRWALKAQRWVQGVLRITDEATERGLGPALGVPFVDSAVGDGRTIESWDMVEVNDETCFIADYRGLWGLDTGDPTGGERGPSGPKYNRDGSLRSSWVDPLGFAGLSGTPPQSVTGLRLSREKLTQVTEILTDQIRERGRLLPFISAEAGPGSWAEEAVQAESAELTELLRQRTMVNDLGRQIENGVDPTVDKRGHLLHPAVPLPPPQGAGWLLAFWAALSVPALLVLLAALLYLDSVELAGLGVLVGAVAMLIEQLVRRRFSAVLRLTGVYVAVVVLGAVLLSGLVVAGRLVLSSALVAGAVVLFIANLGELTAVSAGRRAKALIAEADVSDKA